MTKARTHCVKPDTGARMATVIFSLFSNAHYFDSVICLKKAIQRCLKFSFTPGHYYRGDLRIELQAPVHKART